MGKLPVLSGAELVSLLEKNGFLPLHDELAKGTLLAILKQCGLSREELEKMTRK